jgi:hypothetical protein
MAERIESIRELKQKAEECLHSSDTYIRKKAQCLDEGGKRYCIWPLGLEKDRIDAPEETCAVACAVIILTTCGGEVAKSDSLVQAGAALLEKLQQDDGGWPSIPPSTGEQEESLTLDTFFALKALLEAGRNQKSLSVQRAANWFIEATNPKDGAWGFLSFKYSQRDDNSYVLSTCYAIRALCLIYKHTDRRIHDTVGRALQWLREECRNPDGSYGRSSKKGEHSAIHTASAIIALRNAGWSEYSLEIKASVKWLLENLNECEHVSDNYVIPLREAEKPIRKKRDIYHVTFPEGYILQGLIRGGAYLLDSKLLELVKELIDKQKKEAHWQCINRPPEHQPIYAIMDACLGLQAFIEEADKKKDFLDFAEPMMKMRADLDAQIQKIDSLASDFTIIKKDVQAIQKRTAVLKKFESLKRHLRKFAFSYIFLVSFVVYLFAGLLGYHHFKDLKTAGILGVITLFIALTQIFLAERLTPKE